MNLTVVQRGLWKAARLLGGRGCRWSWDSQFASGRWSYLESTRSQSFAQICASICAGGTMIDCGCGEGWLLDEVVDQKPKIGAYYGFDISSIAVSSANSRHRETLTPHSFAVTDMASWHRAEERAALILVEESIYYLSAVQRHRFVEQVLATLAPKGVALIVVHDSLKYTALLDDVEQSAPSAIRATLGTRTAVVIGTNLDAVQRAARIISIYDVDSRSMRRAA